MKITAFQTLCACVILFGILFYFGIYRYNTEAKIKELDYKDSITALKKDNALQRDSLIDEINYLKFRHPK